MRKRTQRDSVTQIQGTYTGGERVENTDRGSHLLRCKAAGQSGESRPMRYTVSMETMDKNWPAGGVRRKRNLGGQCAAIYRLADLF